jgi:general L-amino acid transport system substrate-binding protein
LTRKCTSSLLCAAATCFAVLGADSQVAAQETLESVRDRGFLKCGVSEGLIGFSLKTLRKGWHGFDVDYCRAVAAAIFEDSSKVEFVPLSATDRLNAVRNKKVDVLSRTTTWTMSRDVTLDLDFVGVWYFDLQGLMVNQAAGIGKLEDINDMQICAVKGTTLEQNLPAFLSKNAIKASIIFAKTRASARKYYVSGLCKVYADDTSTLVAERALMNQPKEHIFLSSVISKEPLGPVVRASDPKWRELLQWVLFCSINAEEAGWTSKQAKTANLPVKIKVPASASEKLGLPIEWCRTTVAQVGNYGEIFERSLGAEAGLNIQRGLNALWFNGGLMFAPPMR